MKRQLNLSLAPPEIWQKIVNELPTRDKRHCLQISRFFRELAIRTLFAKIHVHFGVDPYLEDYETDDDASLHALRHTRLSMTWDILQRIIHDSAFAAVVTSVVVYSYSQCLGLFEQRTLCQALVRLHGLQALSWHGDKPGPANEITQTLANSCPFLRELAVPLSSSLRLPLPGLKRLRSLQLYRTESLLEPNHESESLVIREAIRSNQQTLRKLQIQGQDLRHIPPSELGHLTELTIMDIGGARLGEIVSSLVHLQFLSVEPDLFIEGGVFDAFAKKPSSLPRLRTLKVMGATDAYHRFNGSEIAILAQFLEKRVSMRRLDVCIACDWEDLAPLLHVLPGLKDLTVLGMHFRTDKLTHEIANQLRHFIPRRTNALRLSMSTTNNADRGVVLELLSALTMLEFVYLRGWPPPRLTVEEIAKAAQRVKLAGLNGRFYHIERSERVHISSPWSAHKTYYREAGDFGCEDWEWLMRHYYLSP
ncbi:hypothetical protein WOLCODRAFT_140692 [Wolfiporia cocos MD-104 SS10]|uniref:F-box domain-containing protein n=1 Tax=Wolfiporia cocos (strain MD-104) TaxID=742152 RepID=A0A2H3J465_WOLCO|nr:hypothetical protein WOLCODRAFT_140692 [Wolfiporia cocos MD-104 SS10]